MSRIYTYAITGMRADSVALEHGDLSKGFPAATAWAGYANALTRDLRDINGEVILGDWRSSVVPVIHEISERVGRVKSENYPQKPVTRFSATGDREKTQGTITFSMLLMTHGDTVHPDALLEAVRASRLAGSPVFLDERAYAMSCETQEAGLSQIGKDRGPGQALVPSHHHLMWVQDHERVLAAACLVAQRDPEAKFRYLISPVGYGRLSLASTETAEKLPGARSKGPYAAAEPIMGLLESWPVSRRGVSGALSEEQLEGFRMFADPDIPDAVYVSPAYAAHHTEGEI